MSAFTEDELRYLTGERRFARLATVGKDTTPHVAPVGWTYNAELDTPHDGGTPSTVPSVRQTFYGKRILLWTLVY